MGNPGSWPGRRVGNDRPLPFVVQVAAKWLDVSDDSHFYEALFFKERIKLTGNVYTTLGGQDIHFSDLGNPA